MDEILINRVEKLKEKYDRSIFLTFIIILALLFFHITTFNEFISVSKKAVGAESHLAELTADQTRMKDIDTELNKFRGNTRKTIERLLNDLVKEALIPAFEDLNTSVAPYIRHLFGDDPLRDLRRDLDREKRRSRSSIVLQAPVLEDDTNILQMHRQPTRSSGEPKYQIPEQQIEELKSAGNMNEVRQILQPFVKEQIIDPEFENMNKSWKTKISRMVTELKTSVNTEIAHGRSGSDKNKEMWDEVVQNLDEVVKDVESIDFRAPENDRWWWSVERKGTTTDQIHKSSDSLLKKYFDEFDTGKLIRDMEQKRQDHEQLIRKLDEREKDIKKQFDAQLAALQSMGSGLKFVTFNLETVVLRFPVLLGIGLGVLILWTAYRRSELAHTISFVEKQSPQFTRIKKLYLWDTIKTAHNPPVKTSAILVGFLWIGIATIQLASEGLFCMEIGADDLGLRSADCSTWGKAAITFLVGAACYSLALIGQKHLQSGVDALSTPENISQNSPPK